LNQCIIREINNYPANSRFVFINAWNEWGESAYLEPDRKFGYAYLDATSKALCSATATKFYGPEGIISGNEKNKKSDTAVILHLYYEDLFEEIKNYLKKFDDFDLYISIPDSLNGIEENIFSSFPTARVLKTKNRGRDMAPFISIFRVISEMNYQYLLKIHTKKSSHREDGVIWRRDIYQKLMGSKENINAILEEFRKNKEIGIIGPEQHVVDHSIYWGSNETLTRKLAARAGIRLPSDPDFVFVAGSMFWARPQALMDLNFLPVDFDDFESEPLPPDGTLAHALERFLGLSVLQRGYTILEIDKDGNISDPKKKRVSIYPFAVPSR
jgi:lipopolysaccharide biosynthesis protein